MLTGNFSDIFWLSNFYTSAQISDEIKSGECCSTIKLLDEYKKMDNPEQKHNIFRIIAAILVADRRNSYDNFFAVASEDLVEFLAPLRDVLLSDDCPLTADSLTGKVPTVKIMFVY